MSGTCRGPRGQTFRWSVADGRLSLTDGNATTTIRDPLPVDGAMVLAIDFGPGRVLAILNDGRMLSCYYPSPEYWAVSDALVKKSPDPVFGGLEETPGPLLEAAGFAYVEDEQLGFKWRVTAWGQVAGSGRRLVSRRLDDGARGVFGSIPGSVNAVDFDARNLVVTLSSGERFRWSGARWQVAEPVEPAQRRPAGGWVE